MLIFSYSEASFSRAFFHTYEKPLKGIKNMKKIIATLFVLIFTAGCFCACNKNEDSSTTAPKKPISTNSIGSDLRNPTPATPEEFKLSDFSGKTLGTLDELGFVFQGYEEGALTYIFYYASETKSYTLRVLALQESKNRLKALDVTAEDYEVQLKEVVKTLVVLNAAERDPDPIITTELAKYMDKKVEVLIRAGFEVTSYSKTDDGYTFVFEKDGHQYDVVLDNTVNDIMTNTELSANYKTNILNCIVRQIRSAAID